MKIRSLEEFGEEIRKVLPGAEFQDVNGEYQLIVTILPEADETGEFTVTYSGGA
jgi:hypothetical protein